MPQPSSIARTRRALFCALAIVVLGAGAAGAGTPTTVTFTGGGFGHGLGMSQYGAYGMASGGAAAGEILRHYYTGIDIETRPMPKIRVGLVQGQTSVGMTSQAFTKGDGKVTLKVAGEHHAVASGRSTTSWRIESVGEGVMVFKDGSPVLHEGSTTIGDATHPLIVKYQRFGSAVTLAPENRTYPFGRIEIGSYASSSCPTGSCMRAVAVLAMQEYLYGIGEMPSSWPLEALRAQVTASRTYAYRRIVEDGQNRAGCACAVVDTSYDQSYLGDEKRVQSGPYWSRWVEAVDSTSDRVVLYGGAPILAAYTSSSGGHTENNENVWGGSPLPYLRGVDDPSDATGINPNHEWTLQMSWATLSQKLDAAFGTGVLQEVEIKQPLGVSGRVTVAGPTGGGVRIAGSTKTVRVSGWAFKAAVGLRDTLFRITLAP